MAFKEAKGSGFSIFLSIILLLVTVGLFSYWGYQWVQYVLSVTYNVATDSTFFDLFIGLIAMISSIPVFIGAFYLWNYQAGLNGFLNTGAIGFLIKNALEIGQAFYDLSKVAIVESYHITSAAWSIGGNLFQTAFWIFVLIYINRDSFKSRLS